MTHGVAGVTTLYDEKGNPVTVRLVNGSYQMLTTDSRTHDQLDEIKLLLQELIELQRR